MSLIRSVSGVRGIVRSCGDEPVTMDESVARRMGRAYATYLRTRHEGKHPRMMLVGARDGRAGGDTLLSAFADGARQSGVAMLELGIVTTPGAAMMVHALSASGGVVITASHNPSQWNGIKLMTPQGQAPTAEQASEIFRIFDAGDFHNGPAQLSPATPPIDPHEHHIDAVMKIIDAQRISGRSFSVVLDSINGAGAKAGRMLLERLGCSVTHINNQPDTDFAHTPEPIEANLKELCRLVRGDNASDVGFAQDPDADRLAIVDEKGRFIGEEYTLALCAKRVFTTNPGPAATNLSTSRMIDSVAQAAGEPCRVYRSRVGEANVVEVMRQNNCVFGGEGNGGVIDPRVVHVRDSLVAMALTLDLLAAEERPLSQVVNAIPSYVMLKEKISCDSARIPAALNAVRTAFSDGNINDIDGVRIDWPQAEQWLHVRGSNTEPIMRIIVEATRQDIARNLMSQARKAVQQTIG